MSKKFLLGLIIAFVAITFTPGTASAISFYENFDSFYMTGAANDTTAQTSFGYTDTPWLYIKFLDDSDPAIVDGDAGRSIGQSLWTWDNTSGADQTSVRFWSDTKNEVWISFADWESMKQEGDWTVSAFADLNKGSNAWGGNLADWHSYYGTTSFQVTPEPISSILFLTGGFAFVGRSYRNKKQYVSA